MDLDFKLPCPIVLGRPFFRTIGAIIDMRVGNIKFQFPLKKGMENFSRKRIRNLLIPLVSQRVVLKLVLWIKLEFAHLAS